MPETSPSLLERICFQGDSECWERLVGLYTPLLQSWLRRYQGLSAADIDDLVKEVLLTMSQELPGFRSNSQRGAFRTWLRVILVNRLRNFWRSRQHQPLANGGSDILEKIE